MWGWKADLSEMFWSSKFRAHFHPCVCQIQCNNRVSFHPLQLSTFIPVSFCFLQKSFLESPAKVQPRCTSQVGNTSILCVWSFFRLLLLWWLNLYFYVQGLSEKILSAGKILRNAILSRTPHMICDRKHHLSTYRLASHDSDN